jgi:probable F420-dependent oxidoreductase
VKLDTAIAPAPLKDVRRAARAAEDVGFDALWTAETSHDPFLPLLLAAEETRRVKLGTSIAVAFPRSPMVLAQIAWDLQAASGGRFILGLGTQVKGHNERRFGVKWEHPTAKLREMIQMMRAIWDCWQTGSKPSFVGKFYNFTLMTPFFNPGPIEHPHVPVYIAGVNELICRLAGELCDGFHIHPLHSVRYLREAVLPNIEKGAAKTARRLSDVALSTSAFVITGANADEMARMKAAVRQQISFYASTRTYAPVLELHGWGDACMRLNEKAAKGDWAGMANEITDDMLEAYAVTAPHADLAGELKKKYDGLLDRLALYTGFVPGQQDGFWRELAKAIGS